MIKNLRKRLLFLPLTLYIPLTAWKVSVFGVILSVFSRIRTKYRKILRISLYSVRMRWNTDQKNSKYGHFLRSGFFLNWLCFLKLQLVDLASSHRQTSGLKIACGYQLRYFCPLLNIYYLLVIYLLSSC